MKPARVIDLTRTLAAGMPVFPGDERPQLFRTADFAQSGYLTHVIRTSMHTGTHMDGPLHMLPEGARLCDIPPQRFMGRGVLLDARGRAELSEDLLQGRALEPGDMVLILTGRAALFDDPAYFQEYPAVTEGLAQALAAAQVSAVGVDTPSVDPAPFTVHKILLGKGMLILENLVGLEQLAGVPDFEVLALPAKIAAEAAPARVLARLKSRDTIPILF